MKKINYWAVLVAIIVTFVVSAIWYGAVFAHQYFTLRGIDPNDHAATAMSAWQVLVVLVRHLVVTLVMAYLFVRMDIKKFLPGLGMGFLLWLGFPAVLLAGSVASDKVPIALAALHGGDWLIKLLIIGVILAVWQKNVRKGA